MRNGLSGLIGIGVGVGVAHLGVSSFGAGEALDNWSILPTVPSTLTVSTLAFGNGVFVAPGFRRNFYTSYDGRNWTERTNQIDGTLTSVAYGAGKFVAVGTFGNILTSTGGITWVKQDSGTSANLLRIIFRNGLFLSVGYDGAILSSSDGTRWTSSTLNTKEAFEGIEFGSGTFVAVGYSVRGPLIYTSSDAKTWTKRNAGTGSSLLRSVTYRRGQFVAVGRDDRADNPVALILTSPDGMIWTRAKLTPRSDWPYAEPFGDLNDVTEAHGLFVAVGAFYPTDRSDLRPVAEVYTSADGQNWRMRETPERLGLSRILYHQGSFLCVGSGKILQSASIIERPVIRGIEWDAPNGGFLRILADAPKDTALTLEASPDFKTWERMATLTNRTGQVEFLDKRFDLSGSRFYRVTILEP